MIKALSHLFFSDKCHSVGKCYMIRWNKDFSTKAFINYENGRKRENFKENNRKTYFLGKFSITRRILTPIVENVYSTKCKGINTEEETVCEENKSFCCG